MKRVKNYAISKESVEDMVEAGRHNPMLEITFRDRKGKHTQKLYAGYGDRLTVYREGQYTFVVAQGTRLGYVGLEVFKGEEQTGELFVEETRMKDTFGKENPSPITVIRRLRDMIGAY